MFSHPWLTPKQKRQLRLTGRRTTLRTGKFMRETAVPTTKSWANKAGRWTGKQIRNWGPVIVTAVVAGTWNLLRFLARNWKRVVMFTLGTLAGRWIFWRVGQGFTETQKILAGAGVVFVAVALFVALTDDRPGIKTTAGPIFVGLVGIFALWAGLQL